MASLFSNGSLKCPFGGLPPAEHQIRRGRRVRVIIIDAKSLMGIYKSLRYRFRKYPAFIVDREEVIAGWDREKLYDILDAHLQRARG